jgi:hypothetical protein
LANLGDYAWSGAVDGSCTYTIDTSTKMWLRDATYHVTTSADGINEILAGNKLLATTAIACTNWNAHLSTTSVYDDTDCTTGTTVAVVIIAYDTSSQDNEFYMVKNSYTAWGTAGIGKVKMLLTPGSVGIADLQKSPHISVAFGKSTDVMTKTKVAKETCPSGLVAPASGTIVEVASSA